MVDITYLRNPSYLSSLVGTDEMRAFGKLSYEFMERNAESETTPWGFNLYERNKMKRLWEMLELGPQGEDALRLEANRRELRRFTDEYNRRKGIDLTMHFTDIKLFLESIKAYV